MFAVSNGPNRVPAATSRQKTETDPVSQTVSSLEHRMMDKVHKSSVLQGRDIAEAVSRWLPTAAARVQS
jgi:hypothetical protein